MQLTLLIIIRRFNRRASRKQKAAICMFSAQMIDHSGNKRMNKLMIA